MSKHLKKDEKRALLCKLKHPGRKHSRYYFPDLCPDCIHEMFMPRLLKELRSLIKD